MKANPNQKSRIDNTKVSQYSGRNHARYTIFYISIVSLTILPFSISWLYTLEGYFHPNALRLIIKDCEDYGRESKLNNQVLLDTRHYGNNNKDNLKKAHNSIKVICKILI